MANYYNFYGARKSKSGTHANVTLIRTNEAGQKEFANATIKLEKGKAEFREQGLVILVKELKSDEQKPAKAEADAIPF